MKKGFTLSEVLITLGIVGIVAVLTIPGVMRNYQNRLYTAQLEKVYAQISDSIQAVMNDEHVDSFYETSAAERMICLEQKGVCTGGLASFLSDYFKIVKNNCLKSDEPCVSTSANFYKSIKGSNLPGITADYCVQTISGATICGINRKPAGGQQCVSLLVDVNGMAQPNVAGRDIFSMDIHSNGSISDFGSACADGDIGADSGTCSNGSVNTLFTASSGCLNNIMEAGWKMEY